jgi:hypothetical protein
MKLFSLHDLFKKFGFFRTYTCYYEETFLLYVPFNAI